MVHRGFHFAVKHLPEEFTICRPRRFYSLPEIPVDGPFDSEGNLQHGRFFHFEHFKLRLKFSYLKYYIEAQV